jgi:hypothetical protein
VSNTFQGRRSGDVFAVPAGKSHSEEIGPQGAQIIAGRKY